MKHSKLVDIINCMEYGTNIHICVVFLNNYGNYMTSLPTEHSIHSKPYCEYMKTSKNCINKCVQCRNEKLKRAVVEKKSFEEICFAGIYEYCYPVVDDNNVIAVIFLGNILTEDSSKKSDYVPDFADTIETDCPENVCKVMCEIISNHIKLLIEEYSGNKPETPIIVTNMINYLEDTLLSDVSVTEMAVTFNYSAKYMGKLFKKYTGKEIREYVNERRLARAKTLIANSNNTITEIAGMVGYNNATYFSKLFKKRYSVSPYDYRKQQLKASAKFDTSQNTN